MAKIAFIGLGNMGGPMAANLLKAQHQVVAAGFALVAHVARDPVHHRVVEEHAFERDLEQVELVIAEHCVHAQGRQPWRQLPKPWNQPPKETR